MKFLNFDEKATGRKRLLKLAELKEMRLQAYKNLVIYKMITKRYQDKNFVKQIFIHRKSFSFTSLFIITKVFPMGVVENQDPSDTRAFKVNG